MTDHAPGKPSVWPFAIVPYPTEARWPTGPRGTAISVASRGPIGAAFARLPATHRPDLQDVAAHAAVCDAALAAGPVLPFRFASRLRDVAALTDLLEAHRAGFEQDLARLDGLVEIAVTVQDGDPSPSAGKRTGKAPVSGLAYLQARQGAAMPPGLARLQDALRAQTVAIQVAPHTQPPVVFRAACLVLRGAIQDVRRCAQGALAGETRWRLGLTGPWPPFHFMAAPAGAATP